MAAEEEELIEVSSDTTDAKRYKELTREEISQLRFPQVQCGTFRIIRKTEAIPVIADPLNGTYLPPENLCDVCINTLSCKPEKDDWMVEFPWGCYDLEGMYLCRKLHSFKPVKSQLLNEAKWCQKVTNQPWCDDKMKHYIHQFYECLSKKVNNRSLGEKYFFMTPEIIRCFASSYWYGESQLNAIGALVNACSKHAYVFPIGYCAKPSDHIRYYLLFINVKYSTATGISHAVDDNSGSHWTLAIVDNSNMQMYYGDSMLWPVPQNIHEYVSCKIGRKLLSVSEMHKCDGHALRSHVCQAQCFPYPLQNDTVSCGPFCSLIAVLLGSDEETAHKFFSCDNSLKRSIDSLATKPDLIRCQQICSVMGNSLHIPCFKLPFLETVNSFSSKKTVLHEVQVSSDNYLISLTNDKKHLTDDTVCSLGQEPDFLLCAKSSKHDKSVEKSAWKENVNSLIQQCEFSKSCLDLHTYAKPKSSDQLNSTPVPVKKGDILNFLPDGYKYSVDSQQWFSPDGYLGAPEASFNASVWVDVNTCEAFEEWLRRFQEKTKTVYRITATYKPSKHIAYRTCRHCQHRSRNYFTKPPPSKKRRVTLPENSRSKAAGCGAIIKGVIYKPNSTLYHRESCLIKLDFRHSHPIESAHLLSFQDISDETKHKFKNYFKIGHSVASAKLTHEIELQLSTSDDRSLQRFLADRSTNPSRSDLHRLRRQWLVEEIGPLQGTEMFDEMEKIILEYNSSSGGVMKMQRFQADDTFFPDHHNVSSTESKKLTTQPLLLAICTPVMKRFHSMFPQSGEMIFCDATSTLDVLGCTTFILSSATPAGAIPIGVLITSGESRQVLTTGFQLLKEALPEDSFFGRGKCGPTMFMTDDSDSEKQALKAVWPESTQLLCVFHILQAVWRWLMDSKHGITDKFERQELIQLVKAVLYSKTEDELGRYHKDLIEHHLSEKHTKFKNYYKNLFCRKMEWATAHQNVLKTRGCHTNNYAEASVRVLKEIVFQRTKAYNIIQTASFITDTLERYIQRRLLSLAHNRMDHFITAKFLGIGVESVDDKNIKKTSESSFEVRSSSTQNVTYNVDLKLGICSCSVGINGRLCKHQAAVIKKSDSVYLNAVPFSAAGRQVYAQLALGKDAAHDISFYVGLKENINLTVPEDSKSYTTCEIKTKEQVECYDTATSACDDSGDENVSENHAYTDNADTEQKINSSKSKLQMVLSDLTSRLNTGEPSIISGIEHFTRVYLDICTKSNSFANSKLASAFHNFGKNRVTTFSDKTS